MKAVKIFLTIIVAVLAFCESSAQEQYLHLYKGGSWEKSYRIASIDSALFDDSSSTNVYLDLYRNGRKHRAADVAEFDSFKIGGELVDVENFAIIDLDNEVSNDAIDIFNNLKYDEMVKVEGGTFTMGATSEQGSDYASDELPTHQVTLSDYYIGKYEVTQQLWEYVMSYSGTCADGSSMSAYASDVWLGSNPSSSYGVGDNYPAYYVSWGDIVDIFIPRLNKITGKTFRLPTEAEWEYAARGGKNSKGYKYSGSDNIDDVAWCNSNSGSKTHQVGTKQPNELGIYDMSGNLFEWCSDWYGSYSSSSQTNPTGSSSDSGRVGRGGSFGSVAWGCRVSSRGSGHPSSRFNFLGFRLVLVP